MRIWIILAVIAALIVVGVLSSRRNKAYDGMSKLDKQWGRLQSKKYGSDDYENISHYAKLVRDRGFYIDDITWNDLELDRIFKSMDIASSSIGREHLYKTIRMPETDVDEIGIKDSAIKWFSSNSTKRKSVQTKLSRLGFVHNFSFSDYIDSIQGLKSVGSGISILLDCLLAAAILFSVFANAAIGIIFVVAVVLTATAVYFKKKPAIEPYFTCLSQVSRMVRTGMDMREVHQDLGNAPDSIKRRFSIIEKCTGILSPCIKGDFLIADCAAVGSPAEVFMNYIRMFTHVDIIHYNRAIKNLQGHSEEIMELMEGFGYIETCICAASFREAVGKWSVPELTDEGSEKFLYLSNVIHPLVEECVPNSINVPYADMNSVLITGSNASGKSTFLKAVAINALLSQAISTSLSDSYKAPVYRLFSSMSLRDDLKNSGSYYMVEIKSLKRIMDAAKEEGDKPVLCFVDEVLRGTNTIERISASSSILEKLSTLNAVTFAATHDIELTSLLDHSYANYHLREEMTDTGIEFSYKLFDGPATTRNAIALLENLGYDSEIINKARRRAQNFTDTGIWK